MTFHGTLAALNAALATASYAGAADYNGSAQVSFSVTDGFGGVVATGSGSATSDSKTVNVTVTAVNDPVSASAGDPDARRGRLGGDQRARDAESMRRSRRAASRGDAGRHARDGVAVLARRPDLHGRRRHRRREHDLPRHARGAQRGAGHGELRRRGRLQRLGAGLVERHRQFGGVVATGSGSATSDSKDVAVTVTAVNDPVGASAPATLTLAEDASAAISGLSIADATRRLRRTASRGDARPRTGRCRCPRSPA